MTRDDRAMDRPESARLPPMIPEVLLVSLVAFAAYLPALRGGFVWDDDAHVTSPALQSLHGLKRIWFDPGATQQYYPVLHTAFWLEHRLWGNAAMGYHLANVMLHAGAACLLFRILRRLAVPGALLAALVFSVHPVGVETVAWISEQKNTLSAVFYFLAGLAYFRYDRDRGRIWYALGLGSFVLAILSKSVTATLPAALLVVIWWRRGRLSWRTDVLPLAPWLALGAGVGSVTAWMERMFVGASGPAYQLGLTERCLLASRAIWFYLGKLLWPVGLTFIYPHWSISSRDPESYAFLAALAGALLMLWILRRRTRGPLATGLLYAGTLFPALGFINVFPFIYSFVADHFQYLASAIMVSAVAAFLTTTADRLPAGFRRGTGGAAAGLVILLAALTWRQCEMYANVETLWRATIARNPTCWMAYNNLASALLAKGRADDAIVDVRESLTLNPDNSEAWTNLGDALASKGRMAEAFGKYDRALELQPGNVVAHNNYGNALTRAGRLDEAVAHYEKALEIRPDYAVARTNLGDAYMQTGRLDAAAAEYVQALKNDPGYVQARTNLGVALLREGRGDEGIAQLQKVLAIDPKFTVAEIDLANALLQKGQTEAAIGHYYKAIALDPNSSTARNNLGYALLKTGRTREAVVQFEKVLEIDPATARSDPGYDLLQRGRIDEAIERFQREIDPKERTPL